MRRIAILSAALAATVLAGCATSSLTPTVETRQSIISYDIQGLAYQGVAERIVATHREVMSSARIERTFAPDPLPASPGQIRMDNPFAGTSMAGMARMGGSQFLMPQCDGAQLVITADDTSFGRYGETTRYTSCVWAYAEGVHLEVYSAFTQRSGASADLIGRQVAQAVLNRDSSEFIARTHERIVGDLVSAGARVEQLSSRES